MIVALIVGVILAVFGGIVLIKFPDRPGGRMVLRGMEVSSVGAGFPLIVIGAVMILGSAYGTPAPRQDSVLTTSSATSTTLIEIPTTRSSSTTMQNGRGAGGVASSPFTTGTAPPPTMPKNSTTTVVSTSTTSIPIPVTSSTTGTTIVPTSTPIDNSSTPPTGDCQGYFSGIPQDRIKQIESGAKDFDVLRADQSKEEPIGLEFKLSNQRIGGIRFQFFPANKLFKIQSVINANCQWVEPQRPGPNPYEVPNCQGVDIALAGAKYAFGMCERPSSIRVAFYQAT